MLYNPAGIIQLIDDMTRYHTEITAEQQNAAKAADSLVKEGWQSGGGGAADSFLAKHSSLNTHLEELLGLLKKGRDNVQAALDQARATDQHVADDFAW
ncbi:WXG100 family type VII secretion target [Nocardia salmonicida]|uniref:WXG100 family type VII secretion target n=1 Tax=Nocardia salmonicida TaxID=53431 RepID=UPI0036A4C6BB